MHMKSNQQGTFTERQLSRRNLFFLGAVTASLYFIFILLTFFWLPPHTGVMMRHGGIFFVNTWMVGLFLFALCGLTVYFFFLLYQGLVNSVARLRIVVFFSVVFILILFLGPPFFSADLYGYIGRAGISNIHEVNPYFTTPAEYGYDDVVAWPDKESIYGPLYTSLSLGLNKIAGTDIGINLIVFRLAAALAFLGCAYLIYKITTQIAPRYRFISTVLFIWNPLLLIQAIHSAHNDVFMMFLILLSVFFGVKKRWIWAVVALTLAFLIKFSTLVLLPIVFLAMIRQPWRRALRDVIWSLVLIVVIVMAFYLPFGSFQSTMGNLGRAFIVDNNITAPQAIVHIVLEGVDSLSSSFENNLVAVRTGYIIVFLSLYGMVFLLRKGSEDEILIKRFFWILLSLVFLMGGKFNIWYILWCVPLVLLVRDRWYHGLLLLITASGFLYYATLSVFLPNVFFCLTLGIYALMVKWRKSDSGQTQSRKLIDT